MFSENELALKCNISRLTARRAYSRLIELGYAYTVKGKGTFVSKNIPDIIHPKQIKIGIIFPSPTPIFLNLISAIVKSCDEYGYEPIVNFSFDSGKEEKLIRDLLEQKVQALVITPLRNSDRSLQSYRMLMRHKFPFIMIGKPPLGIFCDHIYTDVISVFYSIYLIYF